jgi:hypothetical protein
MVEDSGSAEGSRRLRRKLSKEEWRQLAVDNAIDWMSFPDLPGTHLAWSRGDARRWELTADDGAVWATLRGKSITSSGRNYEIRLVSRRQSPGRRKSFRELVDPEGSAVFSWTGSHFSGVPGTVLSHGESDYAFPIRGSKYKAKVVMSAVGVGESSGPVARFRLTCGWYRAAQGRNPRPVEIVVNPDSLPTHQMALLVAVASPWLRSYFDSGGAG